MNATAACLQSLCLMDETSERSTMKSISREEDGLAGID